MKKEAKGKDYTEFICYIQEHTADFIYSHTGDEVTIQVLPVLKNNETVVQAMRILGKGRTAGPQIYVDDLFREYCLRSDMDQIMDCILNLYKAGYIYEKVLDPGDLHDFSRIRDKLVIRLISGDKNRNLLKTCPHRDFLDMAITYRILAGKNEGGISTALVTNTLMDLWGITEEEIYGIAMENSVRIFPPRLKDMDTIIKELEAFVPEGEDQAITSDRLFWRNMLILSNDCGTNGASAICYPHVLQACARRLESDFFILPSSIHEVILLAASEVILPQELIKTVACANENVVSQEEILSDCVYYFHEKTGKIKKYTGQTHDKLLLS